MSTNEKFLGKAEECEHGAAHLTDLGASGMGCGVCADMELDALDSRVQAGLDAPRVVKGITLCPVCFLPTHASESDESGACEACQLLDWCEVCEEMRGHACEACGTVLCASCDGAAEHADLHEVAS
jgi:hypothetical protein